ncbi:MAG: hypothetical protein RL112_2718 [Planctomycetota bacterium]
MGSPRHHRPPRDCAGFRQRLLHAVLDGEALASLSWDEHLLACADCRALTESEEQLDELLAAWSAPRLDAATRERLVGRVAAERALDAVLARDAVDAPRDFAARILAAVRRRLAAEDLPREVAAPPRRGAALDDEALDLVLEREALSAPAGLAGRVAGAVRARLADEALDALLERDAVRVPAGLARRVQAALRAPATTPTPTPLPRRRFALVRVLVATAAAAAVLAVAWLSRRDEGARLEPNVVPLAQRPEARSADGSASAPNGPPSNAPLVVDARIDERLLGDLELLEDVAVLLDGDLELLLSTMDSSDEALLDLDADEAPSATEDPSKG